MELKTYEIINKTCDEIYKEDRENALKLGVKEEKSLPYFSKKGDIGVILIHGICASPYEMMPIANALEENNFSVYVPLVAGHGTNIKNLIKTNHIDWYNSLNYAYSSLKKCCKKVIIIGQSNGGLLATACALNNNIDALCLLAPAFKTNVIFFNLVKYLKYIIKKAPRKLDKSVKPYYYEGFPLKSLDDMRKLQNYVNSNISNINIPSMLSVSKDDALIDVKKCIFNLSEINSNDKTLYMYNNEEMDIHHILTLPRMAEIRNDIIKWVRRVSNG